MLAGRRLADHTPTLWVMLLVVVAFLSDGVAGSAQDFQCRVKASVKGDEDILCAALVRACGSGEIECKGGEERCENTLADLEVAVAAYYAAMKGDQGDAACDFDGVAELFDKFAVCNSEDVVELGVTFRDMYAGYKPVEHLTHPDFEIPNPAGFGARPDICYGKLPHGCDCNKALSAAWQDCFHHEAARTSDYCKCSYWRIDGLRQGMVEKVLHPDLNVPVFRDNREDDGNTAVSSIHDEFSFSSWYQTLSWNDDNKRFSSMEVKGSLKLYRIGRTGTFSFNSDHFFPLDGEGYKEVGMEGWKHNYGFTTEIHTFFTFQGYETFTFSGDDDVWVFIDNKLVIDLGGLHRPLCRTIDLTEGTVVPTGGEVSDKGVCPDTPHPDEQVVLELKRGQSYKLDLFHAERHHTGSNFRIETSISLKTKWPSSMSAEIRSNLAWLEPVRVSAEGEGAFQLSLTTTPTEDVTVTCTAVDDTLVAEIPPLSFQACSDPALLVRTVTVAWRRPGKTTLVCSATTAEGGNYEDVRALELDVLLLASCTREPCGDGTYQASGCAETKDRTCQPCSEPDCPDGEFRLAACNAHADRICVECSTEGSCGEGAFQSAACSADADRVCSPCSTGSCGNGKYEKTACSANADRVCARCSDACPDGHFEEAACSETSDRVCKPCTTAPCDDGTFEVPCSASQDRICQPCTVCPALKPEAEACSATSDTVCEGCERCDVDEAGWILEDCTDDSPTECRPCTSCTDGETFLATPCTERADAVCSPCFECEDGFFQERRCTRSADTVCQECKKADRGKSWASAPCGAEADAVIEQCTQCDGADEKYVMVECLLDADSQCDDCQKCGDGQYQTRPCGNGKDRTCGKCHESCATCSGSAADECRSCDPVGTFKYAKGTECVAECPSDHFRDGNACLPCHPTCAKCSDAGADQCTHCVSGNPLDEGRCVVRCPDEKVPNGDNECVLRGADCTVEYLVSRWTPCTDACTNGTSYNAGNVTVEAGLGGRPCPSVEERTRSRMCQGRCLGGVGNSDGDNDDGGGLSTGALAGIIAGGAVVLIAAIIGIVYALRRPSDSAMNAGKSQELMLR